MFYSYYIDVQLSHLNKDYLLITYLLITDFVSKFTAFTLQSRIQAICAADFVTVFGFILKTQLFECKSTSF